ncbi:MAG: CbiX/SirB N-terminal domain-containing protein, partial [Chromatiales bacterium]
KRALLVVAHGSRRAASNDEIRNLAKRLSAAPDNPFEMVEPAYLELAEPSIPDGIEYCIQQGAREVVVFPYFLSAGRHVAEDIPAEVHGKQEQHPDISIHVADYLGVAVGMPDMILDHLGQQLDDA